MEGETMTDANLLAPNVSHELAEEHAHAEFAKYEEQRRRVEDRRMTDADKLVSPANRVQAKLPPGPKKTRRGLIGPLPTKPPPAANRRLHARSRAVAPRRRRAFPA